MVGSVVVCAPELVVRRVAGRCVVLCASYRTLRAPPAEGRMDRITGGDTHRSPVPGARPYLIGRA